MEKVSKTAGNFAIVVFLTVLLYMFYEETEIKTNYGFNYNHQNTTLMGYKTTVAKQITTIRKQVNIINTAKAPQCIRKAEHNFTQCKHREVTLSKHRLPVTGLFSFPGSGTRGRDTSFNK